MDERKEMDLEAEEKISVEVPVETDITLEETPKGVFEIGEISERRKANRKVFRMNNGSEKAIIYPEKLHMFNSETEEYEDVDNSLYEDEEEKCFKNGRNDFVAKISNDDANDELFTIEKDAHRITVSAKRSKKQISSGVKLMPKKVIHKDSVDTVAKDAIIFNDAENGADFEYSVNGNGIKENIIVKSKANVYRYAFILDCVNVVAEHIEDSKCVMFNDIETGEPVFNIPAPFMIDAAGETSTAVFYEVKPMGDNKIGFTITADSEWINSEERVLPITIDPQVNTYNGVGFNTFSCSSGVTSDTTESYVGVMVDSNGAKSVHRMYIDLDVPSIPANAKLNKVEIMLSEISGVVSEENVPNIAIYETNTVVVAGSEPTRKAYPLDFAKMKSATSANTYTFDVTDVVGKAICEGTEKVGFAVVSMNENTAVSNYVKLAGAGYNSYYYPKLAVTYDVSYAIGSGEAIHSHELGRLGTGMVDLCSRKLMIDSEDFAWGGNRMPVTIKHLYDSGLHNCQYSYNSALGLHVPNFAAMKLGYGWRLNLMQSIKAGPFFYNGSSRNGYIFINENGEEEYFLQSDERKYDASSCCYYALYKSVDNSDIVYDPEEYTITTGEETYKFSSDGKLISIEDKYGNRMVITYTSGRITSVTDGAGREFEFEYINNGFLKSISLPETDENGNHYCISYTYTDNLLSEITYPDGRMISITSIDNKPSEVILKNSNGESIYKVAYEFEGAYIKKVSEFGVENGEFVAGPSSEYAYSAASKRAQITTTEPADETDEETVTKTVYTFDDEGAVISKYAYIEDMGNVSVGEMSGSINPLAGEGNGIVSNISNLLDDPGFESTVSSTYCRWTKEGTVSLTATRADAYSMHGRRSYRLKTSGSSSIDCGIYQETEELAAGEYTFSAYIKTKTDATGDVAPGAFIRVTKETAISDSEEVDVTVLAESEHLTSTEGEFIRLIAPFELDASSKVKVHILANGLCDAYVDSAQLENSPYANDYNHIENSNFEKSEAWSLDTGASYDTSEKFNGTRSVKIVGDLASARCIAQNVDAKYNKTTRETFVLSGWAKGYGITAKERDGINTPQFRLAAAVFYADSVADTPNYEEFVADFSPCTDDWQFASVEFAKTQYRTVDHIEVYCDYNYNAGVVHFDDIQLVRTNIETGLTAADFAVEPEDDDSEEETTETTTETTPEFTEAVDRFGNTITETTFEDGEFGTIYRAFTYGEDGNALVSEKDARGNVTSYEVDDDTSRNKEVTDRCGNKTAYEYDKAGRTTKVISKNANDVELARVSYRYDSFDNLTRINRGDGMSYALKYNAFHNLEAIGIVNSGAPLVQYTYKNGNGRLKAVTYANGDTMKVTYNSTGQMTSEKWYNSTEELIAHYKYVYDGQGNIVRSIDFVANKEYTYTYEAGRLIRSAECDIVVNGEMVVGKTVVASIMYIYDSEGQLTKKRIIPVGGEEQVIFYENSDDKNTVVKFKVGDRTVTSHSKSDNFGRKVFDELQLETGFVSRQFTYHQGEKTEEHVENGKLKSSPTTQLVKEIILSGGRTLAYEYDAEERITKVTDSVDGVTEYTYDALGQLLTETVNGEVVTEMTYDNYGNILTKNGKVYTYGDSVWKDRLTAFDGNAITYDAQGNPTTYLGHTLTWEKGRQLKSFDDITYTYNANGIRTSKTVGGVKHTYTLDGTKILRETWGENTLVPVYDNEDSVCGIIYNDTPYYFQKNLQGDIIAITDVNGDIAVRYSYNAWGVCTVMQDSVGIATINPFRYRGYYYDEEIGLYYLHSRYYDAGVGRFINADVVINIGFVDSVLTNDIYTFCNNDPVNETDFDGAIISAVLKVVGRMILYAAMNVGIQYLADKFLSLIYRTKVKSDKSIYISVALQGAIDGFWNSGFIGNIMKAVIVNLVKQFIDIVWNGKKFEPTQLCEAVFDGIMSGVLDKLSIKSPKYIRDIKAKARSKGIKGTKKLVQYLTKQKIKVNIWNLGLKALKDFCYNVIKNIITTIMSTLQEIVNDIINSVSSKIKEARA